MKKFERKILLDLFKSSNGLFAYTFFERYKVGPDEIASFIEDYESKGLIEFNENRLFITEKGKEELKKVKSKVITKERKRFDIPQEFIGEYIEINKPYIPDKSELSNEILNL